jgi:MYXO-CTERM domain-containing protein
MQSVFSRLAGMGVLALGLALVPAMLPAQSTNPSSSGSQAATAPSQNNNQANPVNSGNEQNGNAVNPNHNPNQAAVPPAGVNPAGTTGENNGGGGWGLWGLVGLLGLFGLAGSRRRANSVEIRDRDRDINDRRVA